MTMSASIRAATRMNALLRMPNVTRVGAVRAPLVVAARSAALSVPRTFTTSVRRLGQGETDDDLCASLQQEISYEREAAESQGGAEVEPDWLQQFRSEGVWNIEDKPGSDEIALTRSFGNEQIRVLFSIGEIETAEPTDELDADEADPMASGTNNEFEDSFPVRCAINITKSSKGSLNIDAQAQDGQFMIENITYYRDDALATELTAEADWKRRGLYIGPQFETLDENLQAQFESFLSERGIATNLALFIPNYAEYKEQREYCKWLERVKAFVEA